MQENASLSLTTTHYTTDIKKYVSGTEMYQK